MRKYSIVMPVYNSANTLQTSIGSILNQTYSNWELIVIDDGSTDDSFNVMKNYSEKDERVKCFTHENSGPGRTRNLGVSKATGDYIAFLDSDDYYENDFLEQVEKIISTKKVDLVFINSINEQANGKIDYCDNLHRFSSYSKKDLIRSQMTGKLPWGPCSKVVKSEIVKKCDFSSISVGEEAIYSFDILNFMETWDFLEKPLYHYVHNEQGQHKKGGNDPWRQVLINLKKHIIDIGVYEEFKTAVNTLAINSMLIAIYRYSNSSTISKGIKSIKDVVEDYQNSYSFKEIDEKLLSNSSKILFTLVKFKMYGVLVVLSKIRSKFYK